jgi:hypothetical protein
LRSVDHRLALFERHREGLFDRDVLPVVSRDPHVLGMELRGRREPDRFNRVVAAKLL